MSTDTNKLRKQAILGHILLPVLVVGWNLILWQRPDWRQGWMPFQMGGEALGGFWLTHLIWLVIAPLGVAWAFYKEKPWARLPTWILCGCLGYGSLYVLGLAMSLGNGFQGAICMLLLWGAYLVMTLRSSHLS